MVGRVPRCGDGLEFGSAKVEPVAVMQGAIRPVIGIGAGIKRIDFAKPEGARGPMGAQPMMAAPVRCLMVRASGE